MRKSTFLLASLIGFSSWALPTKPIMNPTQDNFNPWNLNFRSPNEKVPQIENAFSQERTMSKAKTHVRNNAPKDASYYVAAQSFYNDYVFYYNGGLVYSYDIDIEVDGDKAVIRHLFDLESQSTDWSINESYDLIGHYDRERATITIPTSQDFSDATFVGATMSGYYYEMLVSGKVLEDGTLDPSDELIFKVVGDFEAITTDMDFGIMNCIDTGEAYGLYEIYRSFYATIPTDEPKLVAMGNIVPIADTYVNTTSNTTFWVANMSN